MIMISFEAFVDDISVLHQNYMYFLLDKYMNDLLDNAKCVHFHRYSEQKQKIPLPAISAERGILYAAATKNR